VSVPFSRRCKSEENKSTGNTSGSSRRSRSWDTDAEKFLNVNAAQSTVPDARLQISDVEIFDWFDLYPIVPRFVITYQDAHCVVEIC
jgi:hypothetical protein